MSGVVGWCLGAYGGLDNTLFTIFTPCFTLGPASTTPSIQHTHCVSRPHILYNFSTTFYNTLQSTALKQFYSLQPLQHPSASQQLEEEALMICQCRSSEKIILPRLLRQEAPSRAAFRGKRFNVFRGADIPSRKLGVHPLISASI